MTNRVFGSTNFGSSNDSINVSYISMSVPNVHGPGMQVVADSHAVQPVQCRDIVCSSFGSPSKLAQSPSV